MPSVFRNEIGPLQLFTALAVFFGMVLVILSVLGFEHLGGYVPCQLCLAQREPYYAAIPVSALAALAAAYNWHAVAVRSALAIVGLLLVYAVILGIHHAGVEWGFWAGPADCGAVDAGVMRDAGELFGQLDTVKPPSCNEAAGRFLGLSFAGWNVVVATVLGSIAFVGSFREG